jgi:hypothetical protein
MLNPPMRLLGSLLFSRNIVPLTSWCEAVTGLSSWPLQITEITPEQQLSLKEKGLHFPGLDSKKALVSRGRSVEPASKSCIMK